MNKLINNELSKIFHKKAIYIVTIIAIVFMILNAVLNKYLSNDQDEYSHESIEYYKEQLKEYDKNNEEEKSEYIFFQTQIQLAELINKYEKNSWQQYILKEQGEQYITNMLDAEGTESYQKYKNDYDKFIDDLNSNNWKKFVQNNLDRVNEEIAELNSLTDQNGKLSTETKDSIENLNFKKQALEWRLNKDIVYSSNLSQIIDKWVDCKTNLSETEKLEKQQVLTHTEEYEKQTNIQIIKLAEYAIENKIENVKFSDPYESKIITLASKQDMSVANFANGFMEFIIITVIIIAGTIVSEEFNKGTIKLLLVKPYKRWKILVAKFIACLCILVISFTILACAQFIINGIFEGFANYDGHIIIYNINKNAVEVINNFMYICLQFITLLPKLVLIMTLSFTLSTLFINSPIAIAIPILGMIGEDILNSLALAFKKAEFLLYFVTPNWDMSQYLFGKMSQFNKITPVFSIIICLIYFTIMAVTSIISFNKREIKNI